MGKLDLSEYDKIIADHYPCAVCGLPGSVWLYDGVSACADHVEEAHVIAKAKHDKMLQAIDGLRSTRGR